MSIFIKDKEITAINFGGRAVTAVYKGAKQIWGTIKSCFGKGFWVNSFSWDNRDEWKNNF